MPWTARRAGNWRAAEPIELPPALAWPPRPLATLKWRFGVPGYLQIHIAAFSPALGQSGFDKLLIGRIGLDSGNYFHYLHHRYFECDYGGSLAPLDKLFGTSMPTSRLAAPLAGSLGIAPTANLNPERKHLGEKRAAGKLMKAIEQVTS